MVNSMSTFDYIVIGGGSAGCVLADRLTACGRHQVLLLEAGPSDRRLGVRVPVGYATTFFDRTVNWMYESEPEPNLGGRTIFHPRGRVLGGSSSINALVYHRGQAGDYDDWAAAGNPGWDYAGVRDTFDAMESQSVASGFGTKIGRRSADGGLSLTDNGADHHALGRVFANACQEAQIPFEKAPRREGEGIGTYLTTTRGGWRCSAADAYLRPAMRRANLTVMTGAHVRRIIMEGRRATGVAFRHRGADAKAFARAEVILSAGAVGSPQLLQISGIGPARLLRGLGIDVVIDNVHVGKHLQDHFGVNYIFTANTPTLNDVFGSLRGRVVAGIRYLLTRRGPLALSVNQLGGLLRSRGGLERPDMQLYLNPMSFSRGWRRMRRVVSIDPFSGFCIGFNSCRPTSEGEVAITSPRAADAPAIRPNYLDDERDIAEAVSMARVVGRISSTPAITGLLGAQPQIDPNAMGDAEILEDLRARGGTVFHLCGTCRMGPAGGGAVSGGARGGGRSGHTGAARGAVVDAGLRVHGAQALRVCDASVFPNITSANTNAPTMMLAHRASKLILQDAGKA